MPAAEPKLADLEADLALLAAVAREAGEVALGYFRNAPKTWMKGNNSPVSDADIAVDRMLVDRLRAARPDYGWLSEETEDDLARLGRERVFVVDPIDGTREFLAGRPGWAISLAIVRGGRPEAAVLFAPALGRLFSAAAGRGAALDGSRLAIRRRDDLRDLRLAGPKSLLGGVAAASGVPRSAIRFVGSLAYRLAEVAAGETDVAGSRAGSHDWDLAAADLIIAEAGGAVTDLAGRPLLYNRETPRHPPIVAGPPAILAEIRRLVAAEVDAASA